jgi:hypothetical protein
MLPPSHLLLLTPALSPRACCDAYGIDLEEPNDHVVKYVLEIHCNPHDCGNLPGTSMPTSSPTQNPTYSHTTNLALGKGASQNQPIMVNIMRASPLMETCR